MRIVSKWNNLTNENTCGLMDKYLGLVMTVHDTVIGCDCVEMEEDDQEWWWNGHTIAEIINEEFEAATPDELVNFIMEA